MSNIENNIKNISYSLHNIHQDILLNMHQKIKRNYCYIKYSSDWYHILHNYLNTQYIFLQLIESLHDMISIQYQNHYDMFYMLLHKIYTFEYPYSSSNHLYMRYNFLLMNKIHMAKRNPYTSSHQNLNPNIENCSYMYNNFMDSTDMSYT